MKRFFLLIDEETKGPFTDEQVYEMVRDGLSTETLFAIEGESKDWHALKARSDLWQIKATPAKLTPQQIWARDQTAYVLGIKQDASSLKAIAWVLFGMAVLLCVIGVSSDSAETKSGCLSWAGGLLLWFMFLHLIAQLLQIRASIERRTLLQK